MGALYGLVLCMMGTFLNYVFYCFITNIPCSKPYHQYINIRKWTLFYCRNWRTWNLHIPVYPTRRPCLRKMLPKMLSRIFYHVRCLWWCWSLYLLAIFCMHSVLWENDFNSWEVVISWHKNAKIHIYHVCVYKNQPSRQTGSRNVTGPKTLPMIWGTYMKLLTKYHISAINSCWKKCDGKYLATNRRTNRGKTVHPSFGGAGV